MTIGVAKTIPDAKVMDGQHIRATELEDEEHHRAH